MTAPLRRPSEDELHALVDGRLPDAQAAALRRRIADDPELTATVEAWRSQRNLLARHLATVADEPLPEGLLALAADLRQRRLHSSPWQRWGGMAAGLLLAFLAGWGGHAQWQVRQAATSIAAAASTTFARQALAAHVVYAPEVRHPVEVDASQQDHLVQWLSKRLGRALKVPHLEPQGFALVGGRLLPAEGGARAQFMYENPAGERVTIYVGALPASATTAFRFTTDAQAASFYWVDQGFGYALSGRLPRQRLLELAEAVYSQL